MNKKGLKKSFISYGLIIIFFVGVFVACGNDSFNNGFL